MGKTHWFECSKCGYRAKVSGGADRGVAFFVQTIHCRDCKELHDAVTRIKVPDESPIQFLNRPFGWRRPRPLGAPAHRNVAPSFQSVLNRLPPTGIRRFKWVRFKPQCPVSIFHKVEPWTAPGKCPKCGVYLEQGALPYRIWD